MNTVRRDNRHGGVGKLSLERPSEIMISAYYRSAGEDSRVEVVIGGSGRARCTGRRVGEVGEAELFGHRVGDINVR